MKIKIYGETITCESAIKGTDYIKIIGGEQNGRVDSGITNFSGYVLIDGEWSNPEPTPLEQAQAYIYLGVFNNAVVKSALDDANSAIAALKTRVGILEGK